MSEYKTTYNTVIGLEIHVELATKTKIFCGCSTAFGGAVNTHTCPVCAGMPGTLPVLNKQVVEYALAVGVAFGCNITELCRFDRKNYFYPDNPQNYQISQFYLPFARDGRVEIETPVGKKFIGIHEIHMEEDAGKLIHDTEQGISFVDYNRAGVPLIEIVTEPDMRSAEEVIAFLEKIRLMIQYLGASDCKLNEGSMRVDVNLSLQEEGAKQYGTRTEMKNLNSFKAISRAIANETKRQMQRLQNKEPVIQETRRWDDLAGCSYSMRSKEDAKDYRYFPEPDIPPLFISKEWILAIEKNRPEFRDEKIKRYVEQYQLPRYDAEVLTSVKKMAQIFEEAVALGGNPKKASNYLMGEAMRLQKEHNLDSEDFQLSPAYLVELIRLVEAGTINSTVAKEVFEKLFLENQSPEEYIREHGLAMQTDENDLLAVIETVLMEHEKSVADYKNGKKQAIGFLIGQTMKATGGTANPGVIKKLLTEQLETVR